MLNRWLGDPYDRAQRTLRRLATQLQDIEVSNDNLMDAQEEKIDSLTEERVSAMARKRQASRLRQAIEKLLHET